MLYISDVLSLYPGRGISDAVIDFYIRYIGNDHYNLFQEHCMVQAAYVLIWMQFVQAH